MLPGLYARVFVPEGDRPHFLAAARRLGVKGSLAELRDLRMHLPMIRHNYAAFRRVAPRSLKRVRESFVLMGLRPYLTLHDSLRIGGGLKEFGHYLENSAIGWQALNEEPKLVNLVSGALETYCDSRVEKPFGAEFHSPARVLEGLDFISTFKAREIPAAGGGEFRVRLGHGQYESPIALEAVKTKEGDALDYGVGQLKFVFLNEGGKRIVAVLAIQGQRGSVDASADFKAAAGANWPNLLLRVLEKHAAANGFDEVRIIRPEYQPSYLSHSDEAHAELGGSKEIVERMRLLYYSVAGKGKYKPDASGKWRVKKLRKQNEK